MAIDIDNLITIGKDGLPEAPKIHQIIDKDIKELYLTDKSPDKSNYIKWAGVIYYLGNPSSPTRQRGLSDDECIKEAIEYFNLPLDYEPSNLIYKLAYRLNKEKITEAGIVVDNLLKAIHNSNLIISKISELLNIKLREVSTEEIPTIVDYMNVINKQASEIPKLVNALKIAKINLIDEKETKEIYGKEQLTDSMRADLCTI